MSAPNGIGLDDKRALAPCLICRSCVGPSYRIPTEQHYAVMDQVIQISNLMDSIQQTEPHLRLLCTECANMCDKHVPSLGSVAGGGQQAPAVPSTSRSVPQAFATESTRILVRSDPPLPQFATLLSPPAELLAPPAELLAHPSDVEMLSDYEPVEQPDADGQAQYGVPLEPLVGTEVLLGSEPGEMQAHPQPTERATTDQQRSETADRAPPAPPPVATATSTARAAEQPAANIHDQLERTAWELFRGLLMHRQNTPEQEAASGLPAVGAAPEPGASASVGRPAVQQQEPLDYSTRNQPLQQHQPRGASRGTEPGAGASASVGASQEGTLAAVQEEPLDYSIRNQQLRNQQLRNQQERTLSAAQQQPFDYSMRSQQQQQVQPPNGNVGNAAGSSAWLTTWREALCRAPTVLQQHSSGSLVPAQRNPAPGTAAVGPSQPQQDATASSATEQGRPAPGAEDVAANWAGAGPSQQPQQQQQQESRGDSLAAAGGQSTGGNELVAGNWPIAGPSQQQHASSSILNAAPGNSANVATNGVIVENPFAVVQQLQGPQNWSTGDPAEAAEQPCNLSRRPRSRRPSPGALPVRRNSRNSDDQPCAHQAEADRYPNANGPLLVPFQCRPCNVPFGNFYAYRQHMFDSHGHLRCPLCRGHVNVFVYEAHVMECYRQAVYCMICRSWYHREGATSPRPVEADPPVARPVEADPPVARPPPPPGKQECQYCGRYFSKYYILRHIRVKHPFASE